MAGLTNLKLLTDFFNKIGPLRQILRRKTNVGSQGDSGLGWRAP
jgi:hypothetical protein